MPVNDFRDLINTSGSSQYVQMNLSDNLMIRNSEGVDSVVEKTGVWRIGFAKTEVIEGEIITFFGGYANNNNPYSNGFEGYEGWCDGYFYDSAFANGESIDDVWVVHDQLGDGMGELVWNSSEGYWDWNLDSNDILYTANQIEFNGNIGDVGQMPVPFYDGSTLILPHMVLVPLQGDANRDGYVDASDYTIYADNYTGVGGSGMLWEQGDFNGDGSVDAADYTIYADNYTGSMEMVPEPASLSLLILATVGFFRRQNRQQLSHKMEK